MKAVGIFGQNYFSFGLQNRSFPEKSGVAFSKDGITGHHL